MILLRRRPVTIYDASACAFVGASPWQMCSVTVEGSTLTPGASVSAGFTLQVPSDGRDYDIAFAGLIVDPLGNVLNTLGPSQEFYTESPRGLASATLHDDFGNVSFPQAGATGIAWPSSTEVGFQSNGYLPSNIAVGGEVLIVFGPMSLIGGYNPGDAFPIAFLQGSILAAAYTLGEIAGQPVEPPPQGTSPGSTASAPPTTPPPSTTPPTIGHTPTTPGLSSVDKYLIVGAGVAGLAGLAVLASR